MDRTLEKIDRHRRLIVGAAAMTLAGIELSSSRTAQAARSFSAIKQIDAGVLNVGYAEEGPAEGPPVILLHGWPYDIHTYADAASLLAAKG